MTATVTRGTAAGQQAYAYIAAGNPDLPGRQLRRLARLYLRVTATPPLAWRERIQARIAIRHGYEEVT